MESQTEPRRESLKSTKETKEFGEGMDTQSSITFVIIFIFVGEVESQTELRRETLESKTEEFELRHNSFFSKIL